MREARLRQSPRLSQDALSGRLAARGVSVDRAGIAKIETARRYVSDFEVRALALSLGVSVGWILGMEE